MKTRVAVSALCLAVAAPAAAAPADPADLEEGFQGALRGCEQWVLNPASWADGLGQFVGKLGLGNKAGWVRSVDEVALPPKEYRVANHYLRINSTANAGFILVVSDRLPICHITGGGSRDLEPAVESVLGSTEFQARWTKVDDQLRGDMISTLYQSQEEPAFSMVISRATEPGQRLDRVQVLATAQFEPGG